MPDEPERRSPTEAAPFLSWTVIYIVVVATLAVEIATFAAIRWIYR